MKPSVLRFLVVIAFAALVSACGGSTAPITGPTLSFAPSSPPPPALPAPPAAPSPISYPSAIAAWTGTRTISALYSDDEPRATTTCEETWIIRSQTGGNFAGAFQSTGSGTCLQSGTLNGTLTFSGAISDLTFSTEVGDNPLCTRRSAAARYSGLLSATGITAQAGDQVQCSFPRSTPIADRTISIAMARR